MTLVSETFSKLLCFCRGFIYLIASLIFISVSRLAMRSSKENMPTNSVGSSSKTKHKQKRSRRPFFLKVVDSLPAQPDETSESAFACQSPTGSLQTDSPTRLLNTSGNDDLWSSIHSKLDKWLALYHYHLHHHRLIRGLLMQEGLICAVEGGSGDVSLTDLAFQTWRSRQPARNSELTVNEELLILMDRLESEMSLLGLNGLVQRVSQFSEKETRGVQTDPAPASVPVHTEGTIQATINGVSVSLRFKNSGNNDVNDIETYLQEKLDVLEFIQMDCNKMEISQLAPPKRVAPKLLESPSLGRSVNLSRVDDGSAPFFIGTPTAEGLGINLPLPEEPDDSEDEYQLHWETSSVLSTRSLASRSSSRRRSLSNSSVSSNSSSVRKPTVGMFGRGRMARLANNMSFSPDENSQVAPTSWW